MVRMERFTIAVCISSSGAIFGCDREPIEYRDSRWSMYVQIMVLVVCCVGETLGVVEDARSHKAEVPELRQHVTTRQA